jgi:hypothetical protein
MAVTETTRESVENGLDAGRLSGDDMYAPSCADRWLATVAQVAVALCCQCISHRKLGASLTDLENELDMSEGPLRVVF